MFLLRGFIKHRRSENSPSTMQNSSAKFKRSMASDESDMDSYVKRNYSQKCIILTLSHLLNIKKKRLYLHASSFKPNKADRGHVKY